MIEKALTGNRSYWLWMLLLVACVALGVTMYTHQLRDGLGVTGLSRNVSWGLYIGQFTFFDGIAASAMVVMIPYCLHGSKRFGEIAVFGALLAVAATSVCMLFVLADLGQPARVLNVLFHPMPHSLMFWDVTSLSGFLILNAVIAFYLLTAEQNMMPPPSWLKGVIGLSIPWAVGMQAIGSFLYSGLAARPLWMSAVLAPRFIASALAAGPALLILLLLLLRRIADFDPGETVIQSLATIVAYFTSVSLFLVLVEIFTDLYSGVPAGRESLAYQYAAFRGSWGMTAWMWTSVSLMVCALIIFFIPKLRAWRPALVAACVGVFFSLWMDKGVALIVSGFEPSPLGSLTKYQPTLNEWGVALGVWALGALMLTVFYKIAVANRAAAQ